jgi:hypothetical protein
MSDDGDTGAPETGDAGQQPPEPTQPANDDTGSRNGTPADPWSAIATEFGDPDEVRKRLGFARTWEQRAKDNKSAADQLPTLQQQIDRLQQDVSARDEREANRVHRAAEAQLRGALGERGVKWDDIDEVLRPDPKRLVKDGEPDDDAIEKHAAALAKNAGRPTPDTDQGQRGNGAPPTDMNAMIRRAAGRA